MSSKRNTVTITFTEDADHKALADLAKKEDRTVAGQARHMLRKDLAFEVAVRARAEVPLATPEIRKFTGVVIPDEMPSNGDDIRDNTSHSPAQTDTSNQEPLGE